MVYVPNMLEEDVYEPVGGLFDERVLWDWNVCWNFFTATVLPAEHFILFPSLEARFGFIGLVVLFVFFFSVVSLEKRGVR